MTRVPEQFISDAEGEREKAASRLARAKAERRERRERVLGIVVAHPLIDRPTIRAHVGGSASDVQEALDRLLLSGRIEVVTVRLAGMGGRRYREAGS